MYTVVYIDSMTKMETRIRFNYYYQAQQFADGILYGRFIRIEMPK